MPVPIERIQNNDRFVTAADLRQKNLSGESLYSLLKNNTHLEHLYLRQNPIGENLRLVIDAVRHNLSLKTLDLSQTSLDDSVCPQIADYLKRNHTLSSLNLSYNQITSKGLDVLVDALRHNTTLRALDLGGNPLGGHAKGLVEFTDVLIKTDSLESLWLYECEINDEGAETLARLLVSCKRLTDLHLQKNRITQKGGELLKESVTPSATCLELELYDNDIYPSWNAIEEALQRNIKSLETEEIRKGIDDLLLEGELGRIRREIQRLGREQTLQLDYEKRLKEAEKANTEKVSLLEFHKIVHEQQKKDLLEKQRELLAEKQKLEQEKARLEEAIKK